jgi:TolB protein
LTDNRAIDTEPLWSPDGRHVLFTSDRSGSAQIYRVPARGGRAERLTFDGSFNADASISPDGRRLALVNGDGGRFRIALYDMDRRRAVSLTDGPLDEAPAFAPNGAMILYAAQERGRGVLAAVSEDGGVHQLLVLPGAEVREPAWSPLPK